MAARIKILKEASALIRALWDFIENCTEDDPQRNDKFFSLRVRVRTYYENEGS